MLTLDIRDVDGRTLEELARVIERRRLELGETAENAVRAVAIRTLGSLRALTKTAKPDVNELKKSVRVVLAGGYTASWYRPTPDSPMRRCLRQGGHRVDGVKFTDMTRGIWTPGQRVQVYEVYDRHYGDEPRLVVAHSESEAQEYGARRVELRVRRYTGLARATLAAAQNRLSTRSRVEKAGSAIWAVAQKSAAVKVTSTGFNRGTLAIEVLDRLRYASLALQGGSADINLAIQKAVNSVTGMINARLGEKKFATPFPEI